MSADEDARVTAIQEVWSAGSYEDVGVLFAPATDALVAELPLAGQRVLDAATGTGNTAIAAARAGAEVSAFDLTPRLLAVARERAEAAGVALDLREGDLLDIPFPDASFDVVLSTFGAFTADDPRRCAAELVRVCRPGGSVVTTAWSDGGIFAVLTDVATARHPSVVSSDAPDPRDWADRAGLEAIFAGLDVTVALERRTVWFPFPDVAEALALFERASGTVQRMRAGVEAVEPGGWEAVRAETLDGWAALARPAASAVELPGVYGVAFVTVG